MYFGTIGSSYHTTVATRARFASGNRAQTDEEQKEARLIVEKALDQEPDAVQLRKDMADLKNFPTDAELNVPVNLTEKPSDMSDEMWQLITRRRT